MSLLCISAAAVRLTLLYRIDDVVLETHSRVKIGYVHGYIADGCDWAALCKDVEHVRAGAVCRDILRSIHCGCRISSNLQSLNYEF